VYICLHRKITPNPCFCVYVYQVAGCRVGGWSSGVYCRWGGGGDVYTSIHLSVYRYTYMHIAREKGGGERERGSEIYVHAFVCLCIGT